MTFFLPVLSLILITLKLTHYIDWSWWAVTAPLWGGAVGALMVAMSWGLFIGAKNVIKKRKSTNTNWEHLCKY